MPAVTVSELAQQIGGIVHGDGGLIIRGIATLETAGPEDISFLTKSRYASVVKNSCAACIIAASADQFPDRTVIIVTDPQLGYVKAMRFFHPEASICYEVSPHALINPSVHLPKEVRIEAGAIIGPNCKIGERSAILAGAVLREDCQIGEDCVIHSGAVLYPRTQLGDRVVVHGNAVLGTDGFGFYLHDTSPLKVPQVGRVVVEDDVEIGAGTCIERATLDETRIGSRTKIGDQVQIGHNVKIGPDTVIIGQSGISGSVRIGRACRIWGQVGIRGHLDIGDGAVILARSLVTESVPAKAKVGGSPAMPHLQWKRVIVSLARLPDLLRSLRSFRRQEVKPKK